MRMPSFESWEMLVSIVDDQFWGHVEEILTLLIFSMSRWVTSWRSWADS